jgi:hypothetical protein
MVSSPLLFVNKHANMRVRGDNVVRCGTRCHMPESGIDGPVRWPSMPICLSGIIFGTTVQHSVLAPKRQVAKQFRQRDGSTLPLTVRRMGPVYPNKITMGIFSDTVQIHIPCCIAH